MAVVISSNCFASPIPPQSRQPTCFNSFTSRPKIGNNHTCISITKTPRASLHCNRIPIVNELDMNTDPNQNSNNKDDEVNNLGVQAALSMLRFYKREISPILPNSCRYVPTCSEYSMEAYKKYGVVKGTILTAWRLCRCNPLGGSGFDPPRWFYEEVPSEE